MSHWGGIVSRVLWIGLGGFLGANARYWLGSYLQQRWGTTFPWATFVVNITGSFVLGFIVTLLAERLTFPNAQTIRLAVAIGFIGAYTTFSTFEYETFSLVQTGTLLRAFANALGSLVAGFVAVWLGVLLGKAI